MKKKSQIFAISLACILGMVFLSACATTQPQTLTGFTPGKYQNDEYRFTVEFPDHYEVQKIKGDEVFKVANPNMYSIPVFSVNIADAKPEDKLDSQVFLKSVKKAAPRSKRFKILSEEMITLNDGTPGLAMFFKFTLEDGVTKLQTASMWVIKDGKSFSTNATTILGGDTGPDKLLAMVKSLSFF